MMEGPFNDGLSVSVLVAVTVTCPPVVNRVLGGGCWAQEINSGEGMERRGQGGRKVCFWIPAFRWLLASCEYKTNVIVV